MPRARLDWLFVSGLVLLSCAEPTAPERDNTGGGGSPPPAVASIAVTPARDTIGIGQSRSFSATARDANGSTINGIAITWAIADTSVGTLLGNTFTGRREGTATIRATSGSVSGTASITVRIPAVRVNVDSFATRMLAGTQQTLTASVLDSAGAPLPLRPLRWRSSDTTVATVDSASGLVRARAQGNVSIIATHAALADTASMTVDPTIALVVVTPGNIGLAVGAARQLSAVALSAAGDTVRGYPVQWNSAWNFVAQVNPFTGVVDARNEGSTSVTAEVGGRQGAANVSVGEAVATIEVSPASVEVGEGVSRALTVTVRDASGNALLGREVTWTSQQPSVATVSASGVVTGRTGGQTVLEVRAEGRSTSVTVRVRPSVRRVSLSPDTMYVPRWTDSRLAVTALSATGDTVYGRVATWSAFPLPHGIDFDGNGGFRPVSLGTYRVVATIDGFADTSVIVVGRQVETVTLPTVTRMFVGATARPTVELRDSAGVLLTGREVRWVSQFPSIASVDASGLVTAHAIGYTDVYATSEGKTGSTAIDVRPWPVHSVRVTPDPVTIRRFERRQLNVELRDSLGRVLTDRSVFWQSLRPSVVSVSATGELHALLMDTASVIVGSELRTDTVLVTVQAPTPVATISLSPSTARVEQFKYVFFTATLRDASGNVLPPRPLTWTSTNAAIAYTPGGNDGAVEGYAYGVALGTVTVRAGGVNADGRLGSASVTVIAPPPVASITITPSPVRLNRFTGLQLTATLRDAAGNELVDRPVTWTSSNPSVVGVESFGYVQGIALGRSVVTAASGGRSASVIVDVTLPPSVARVDVTPATGTFEAGTSTQLSAVVLDSAGNRLDDRIVTWTSLSPLRASVSSEGLVRFLTAGSVGIVATSATRADTALFVVTPERVTSVVVSPDPVVVPQGSAVTLTATVRDARNTVLSGRVVTWTSNTASLAAFDSAGVLRGIAQGSGTLSATSEGVTTTVPFTVGRPGVARVMLEPSPVITFVGESAITDVRVVATTGETVTDRPVTYTVGNPAIARVSSTGVVYGVGVGATYLQAISEGVSGVAEIVVESADVDTIVVVPVDPRVMVGQQVRFRAEFYNATGTLLPSRPVSWSSSNFLVGYRMDDNGLVYGREAGSSRITATYAPPVGDSIRGSSVLTVVSQPPAIAEILVEPNPLNLNVGQGSSLRVIPLDANRQVMYGLPSPTFRSDNTSVATVSSGGYVTARGAGTTRVSATINGFSGSTTVNVSGTGGGGGTGGGTGGGGSGGGGSTGGSCSSTTSITAPGPGQASAWYRVSYPKNLEVQIRTGTFNEGSTASPRYRYFINYRNGYSEKLYFTIGWQLNTVATSSSIAVSVPANGTSSTDAFAGGPGTLSLYIVGARLGSFSAPTFCE